jgi:hypothetical protein
MENSTPCEYLRTYLKIFFRYFRMANATFDLLCGLVVRVSGYRSRGQVSIPNTTRFSEK